MEEKGRKKMSDSAAAPSADEMAKMFSNKKKRKMRKTDQDLEEKEDAVDAAAPSEEVRTPGVLPRTASRHVFLCLYLRRSRPCLRERRRRRLEGQSDGIVSEVRPVIFNLCSKAASSYR